MKKIAKKASTGRSKAVSKAALASSVERAFDEIVELIQVARLHAVRAANVEMIELYWRIGDYLHRKIESDGWAKGTVVQLAAYIAQREPGMRGFSPQNLWRMRQFFVAYRAFPKLSPLLRELQWSAHLHILSHSKRIEEREFYLRMATQHHWPVREVARQIESALFERVVLSPPKLSTALRELHPAASSHFKDTYLFEFLSLPGEHSEADLHQSLLRNLGRFLTELGRDFCYIGSEYPVQVGNQDFALDLLFFHRGLNCLLAIELKVKAFQPEHLGKLNFYLEALDRDVRKPSEAEIASPVGEKCHASNHHHSRPARTGLPGLAAALGRLQRLLWPRRSHRTRSGNHADHLAQDLRVG